MPKKGAYILASNHISNLDPVILGISTPRRLHFLAKAELFKSPLMGWWMKKLWAFPIKRGEGDFGALKKTLHFLKEGYPVLLFPEGTRRLDDKPLPPQAGAGLVALKSKVPIVPVYVKDSNKAMPPGAKFFTRTHVTVTYGKPFDVTECPSYEAASQKILDEIYKIPAQ
ncbi:MAG: 1-acyl-sn-glycerol-3-phosphate acyltransferase [Candidatus Omnitrophica bacterium]|nr:1-acyl-sn-glycerol-3-phosphate acyltransferase [Candidatus Omnitrophota bacterium]